jgi:hypothetical protein
VSVSGVSVRAPVSGTGGASGQRVTTVLASLAVKGRAPKTGYSRDQFGPAWSDDNDDLLGGNGCDTRDDILRRDLTATVIAPGCQVKSGILDDPYRGVLIKFTEGVSTSAAVQIDHVVALGDAWQTGAQQWSARTRQDFGNDPLNLLAVNGSSNTQKGDSDAASWLPPAKGYRCAYVARQVAVKARYRLWVTPAEAAAITAVLRSCPAQTVPVEATRAAATSTAAKTATGLEPVSPASASASVADVYYANCAAVRAAGKAPLRRGQPGYRSALDRDGDGVACDAG